MPVDQPSILTTDIWQQRASTHRTKAEQWTLPYRDRRARRQLHPIYDFLFIYYRNTPGQLETWHPGSEFSLENATGYSCYQNKYYSHKDDLTHAAPELIDAAARRRLEFILRLAKAIQSRPPQFGCFGMHEWAMVYHGDNDGEIRHSESLPLRLSQSEINAFVESRPIACSHYDAFRFFTPSAQKFNRIQPCADRRIEHEQAGCLHTNMDLYKWSAQCQPWVGSELLWACFEFAIKARVLDMQASAYDCSSLGYSPIKVETPTGRTEYEQRQRKLSQEAQGLRNQLIRKLESLIEYQ